jgi:hypothetical protein
MPRDKQSIEAALTGKGFRQEDSHHHFFVYWSLDGKKTRARTKTSHTKKHKDIGDVLLSEMARQCKLTKGQFVALVDCPLSREEYEQVLVTTGELPSAPPKGSPPDAPMHPKR